MSEIRPAKPTEYESILRCLSEAYGVSHDWFPRKYPTWWGEQTDFDRIWVMVRQGRIETLVRIFPLNLVLGGTKVAVGGIGSVATIPEARGQGAMYHVMHRAIEAMKSEFCLSALWGERHRYHVLGYENAGSCLRLRLTQKGIGRLGITPKTPKVYEGEAELLRIIQRCHALEEFRRVRAAHEDAKLFAKPGLATWCAGDEEHAGYLAFSTEMGSVEVVEFGGHAPTVLGLVASLFADPNHSEANFVFPTREEVAPEYWDAASSWSVESGGMLKILHLPAVIKEFRPWLREDSAASDPGLAQLKEPEVVDRLFGVGRAGAAPFFCWPLDWI